MRAVRSLIYFMPSFNHFAYSFVFGLLAGNANIVRVPSTDHPQVEIICKTIKNLLNIKKYSKIKKMNAFIKYEKNDEITKIFSSICDARIIWGGDTSIREIRQIQIPERSIEISYSRKIIIFIIFY